MQTLAIRCAIVVSLLFVYGCSSDKSPGEAAGHAAYVVEKDAKKAAKEIGKDLKTFGHDAKEGFQNAKQKDIEHKKAREAERESK